MSEARLGHARSPGRSFDDIMSESKVETPAFLREETYEYRGSEPLDPKRYTDATFFQQECEKMWPNVWQFAAREEELPEPGDYVVYENVGRSYLLIRQDDRSIRAFHNVCLHRGRKLKTESGHAAQIVCPFHGFSWNLNGSLAHIPCRWDFDHLRDPEMTLPEVRVGLWKGYVFIRENPDGPDLEAYLAPLPEHFARWPHEDSVTSIWVAKVVPANWKATAEAFMEAWHSLTTHPQILGFLGDENTQYSIYGDHVNRATSASAVASPHVGAVSEQDIANGFASYNFLEGGVEGAVTSVALEPGATARQTLAAQARKAFAEMTGHDFSQASDSELLDAIVYNVFPNFSPWGGFMPNIVYRWRPWPDQDHTLMEVRFLTRVPAGAERPRSVPMRLLRPDQPWASVKELGSIGEIFDQDMQNLPHVQAGMKASKNGKLQLGNYQEIRIRQFHQTLDKYLSS